MKKWVCPVCGYVHEGDVPPAGTHGRWRAIPPVWTGDPPLRRSGGSGHMYLAMARVAHREGYPEIGLYWEKAAYEEAEHAAKFAELLGEVVTDSTKKNLEMRIGPHGLQPLGAAGAVAHLDPEGLQLRGLGGGLPSCWARW